MESGRILRNALIRSISPISRSIYQLPSNYIPIFPLLFCPPSRFFFLFWLGIASDYSAHTPHYYPFSLVNSHRGYHGERRKLDGEGDLGDNFNFCFLFSTSASYSRDIKPCHLVHPQTYTRISIFLPTLPLRSSYFVSAWFVLKLTPGSPPQLYHLDLFISGSSLLSTHDP